jgi:hypothetical protein
MRLHLTSWRPVAALSAVVLITSCSNGGADTSGTTAPQVTSADTSESTSATVTSDEANSTVSETGGPADEALPTLLPLAPDSKRVDLEAPTFSDPTTVDNPLFPISNLHSAVLLGNNEGQPIRIETTLMHEPKEIDLDGTVIETLVSQFVAYQDGRIHEVATDWYAQGDDGAVYYLGEDVFNYEDGVVADTDGTWIAGDGAPIAMIMPADPQPGDVFRPENIAGELMEEVTIEQIDVTVDGPYGPIDGAIIGEENHTLEGVYENKWFAPGYGEFFSGVGDSLEGLAIGIPTGALDGPGPDELTTVSEAAVATFDAAADDDWPTASQALERAQAAWSALVKNADVPRMLGVQMDRALRDLAGDAMVPAVNDRNVEGARNAALDVALASIDLQIPYQTQEQTDRARFEVWARQLVADSERIEAVPGFTAGDVATLEWIWQRFAHTVDQRTAGEIDSQLADLGAAADEEDAATVAELAPALLDLAQSLH